MLPVSFKRQKIRDHVTPILKELHWLPVEKRIDYKICLFCFKSLNGLAPSYISSSINTYTPTRQLRSASDKTILIQPTSHYKTYGQRSFFTYGPKVWNQLPQDIREASSLNIFKKRLKTHLFVRAYL